MSSEAHKILEQALALRNHCVRERHILEIGNIAAPHLKLSQQARPQRPGVRCIERSRDHVRHHIEHARALLDFRPPEFRLGLRVKAGFHYP